MSNKYKKIEQISIQSQLFKNLYHNLIPGHNFQELSNLIHSYKLKQIKSIKPILNQYSNLKIHKSYYHYINLNKNIIKYYPNINEILNINNSIFNLDLNLPYHVLKKSKNWSYYQQLLTLSSQYNSLIQSLIATQHSINISEKHLKSWLDIATKNKDFIASYSFFKNSELGQTIADELDLLNENSKFSQKENNILFLIFTGFIISFYSPSFSLKIYDYIISLIKEISNNKIISSLGTLYLLKSLAENSINILSDISTFTDND